MKSKYDLKTKVRNFKEGDVVLAYLSVPGSPLSAIYHGPYAFKSKVNEVNYIIKTPDRRKATQQIHVNLLKPYLNQKPAPELLSLPYNVTHWRFLILSVNGTVLQTLRFYSTYHPT